MLVTRWQASIMPSPEQVKMILLAEGLHPQEEIYEPKSEIKNHRHQFDEVRIIVSGELFTNISGNKLILRPGDRIEIPSNTRHSTWVEQDTACVTVWAKRTFRI